jgi:hypothetical protein
MKRKGFGRCLGDWLAGWFAWLFDHQALLHGLKQTLTNKAAVPVALMARNLP